MVQKVQLSSKQLAWLCRIPLWQGHLIWRVVTDRTVAHFYASALTYWRWV